MEYQYFDGMRFYRTNENDYFRHSLGKTTLLLHRYVWEKHNCEIPEGYEIHHIDGDKANNDISNLQLISAHDHRMLHGERLTEEECKWKRQNIKNTAVPKAVEWHKSDEGREWHKQQYEKMKDKLHQKSEHECLNCGKLFMGEVKDKYCSNACKSAYRRKNGLNLEERVCVICGKPFMTDKYRKASTCSRECRGKLKWIRQKQKQSTKLFKHLNDE